MSTKEEAAAVAAGNGTGTEEEEEEELTDEELDELMMEQSKAPGCKKHRGYGKFDKPPVNRGVAVSSDADKEQGEIE
ncbi:hypothetical protein SAMN04488587_1673 [Methanococcoides vulcani]|uniref:Uncharacterized protein n=1 Tax=Methanococcoides vulcani TaxID=1353158 RepID=A0A1I0AIL8_9EURY|nr:hypothetical protein [Methanococcoides vulcani]SES93679.1 hypothetical protein SAMN04488587_1673 [Methanococcoides vulcani]